MIVGIGGYKGVGKTTLAKFITPHVYSFADPVKAGVQSVFGIGPEYFSDREKKETVIPEYGKSPRQLAQWLGTDIMRKQFDEDFWAKRTMKRIEHDLKIYSNRIITIDDLRFPNEMKGILDLGGVVLRVDRPGYFGDNHESEHALDSFAEWNSIIKNAGTIEELKEVGQMIQMYIEVEQEILPQAVKLL